MKKVILVAVLAAFAGFGLLQSVMAADETAPTQQPKRVRPEMKSYSGTIKVDGEAVKLVADDATYTIRSRDTKVMDEYKAKDGQKVEIKGFVRERDGAKTLMIPGQGGPGGRHGKKGEGKAPAAPKSE